MAQIGLMWKKRKKKNKTELCEGEIESKKDIIYTGGKK